MIQTAESMQMPEAVEVAYPAEDVTDIWLRRDIREETREAEEDGEPYIVYVATEAQARIYEHIDADEVTERFDELWELAAEYSPSTYVPPMDNLEVLRADVDFIAMETGVSL